MNSFLIFILIVTAFVETLSALPPLSPGQVQHKTSLANVDNLDSTLSDMIMDENNGEEGDRFPRVTCDILSINTKWGSLQHSACAARCIAMRKKGGYCKDGVCHCRK